MVNVIPYVGGYQAPILVGMCIRDQGFYFWLWNTGSKQKQLLNVLYVNKEGSDIEQTIDIMIYKNEEEEG